MRTGASVGISAKYLGSPTYRVAGMLGCGVQARTSLMAMVETLPNLAEIRCNDLFPASTQRFIDEMGKLFPKLKFVPCAAPAEITRDADIVVTAIPIVTKPAPPLGAGVLKEGGLAVSLDYDSAWTGDAMKQCEKFVCDDSGQFVFTRAHHMYFENTPQEIYADLGELAAAVRKGRENPKERIFSMNMGIAIDDMVTAKVLYQRALERNIGTRLPL
jgi:ornithine cyclodeaminase/alanine dehydrogenase